MRPAADEGVDLPIVEALRARGHDVYYVADDLAGTSDDHVLLSANADRRLLLCSDKDFGELVFRLGRVHAGVALLRLAGLSPEKKAALVCAALDRVGAEMADAFSVIQPGQIRIRKPDR